MVLIIALLGATLQNPLQEYQWKNRLLVVNCGEEEQQYRKQIDLFLSVNQQVKERDLKMILIKHRIALMPDGERIAADDILKHLHLDEDKYGLVLIGKDGGVKFESRNLTSPSTIFTLIDGMPMRRQEMRQRQK